MSRGCRDVLRCLTILLVSGSTTTTLLFFSMLTKISPVSLASPFEDAAERIAAKKTEANSLGVRMANSLKLAGFCDRRQAATPGLPAAELRQHLHGVSEVPMLGELPVFNPPD